MSLESINRLAELTGHDRRTIKKRLEHMTPIKDGRALKYESVDALPAILVGAAALAETLDLNRESARLTHHKANIEAMREQQLAETLLEAEAIAQVWADAILAARAILLNLPGRLATTAQGLTEYRDIHDFAQSEIYAALEALADDGEQAAGHLEIGDGTLAPAAEPDG